MDKRELQELLSQSYKQENWKKIVSFVFPNVSILSTPKEFPISNDKIKTFRQLGNVRLNDGKNLALFELLLSDTVNIQRNRVELNNEISKYIDQEQIHGVLSVFEQGTDDYRFTFSARSTEFDEQESDFVQKKTDTKRYTYVLGKNESCKTPAERFFKLSEKKTEVDINAIQNAFSVEQLSKEFFEKYKKQFEKFWKFIHTNETYNNISFGTDREKGIRDFTKKLLGRIVFLHFLQKKGWMGCTAGIKEWEDGDKQFMQTLFENYSNQSTFHSKCLAELFYNTLNKRRTDDLIVCDGLEGVLSKSKVPYLNGGLFDSDEDITRKIDFPASYFQELFDFFGQYNFTIDENDPNDHEVGIDPEMLGHIFENLLEDNKDKGAFYTPKVIVQYMCQESIIEYINTKINEAENPEIKSAVEDLIRNKLTEKCSDLDLVQPISKALFEVKICDPAIGSGAFPMGILNVIYSAIEELYFIQPDSVASIWNISDTVWQPHLVKKNIIQHSIYGVDLESGAVDIARLRFWLALVVDEIEPLPLPNLDYKIMQGNSLLESFEGIDLSQISHASAYEEIYETEQIDMFSGEAKKSVSISLSFEDIKSLMDEYFNANDPDTKKDIHKKIDDQVLNHIRFTLLQHKQSLLTKKTPLERKLKLDEASATTWQQKEKIRTSSKQAKELAKINIELELFNEKEINLAKLSNSNERPFFLWHLFFKEVFEKGGFDVVIGNPPYGAKLPNNDKNYLKNKYEHLHTRTIDSYNFFIGLGQEILNSKGNLSYIIPSAYLFQTEFEKSRGFFMKENTPKLFVNLGENIFDAVVPSCIFMFNKLKIKEGDVYICDTNKIRNKTSKINFEMGVKIKLNELNSFSNYIIPFNLEEQRLLKTINSKNILTLGEICHEVNSGITTGLKEAFIIPKEVALKYTLEESSLYPTLEGRNLQQFKIEYNEKVVVYTDNGFSPNENPKIIEYLELYKEPLSNRSEVLQGIKNWYSLGRSRGPELLEFPKIMCRETGDSIVAVVDEIGYYPMNTVICIKLINESIELCKAVTVLLNSDLLNTLFKITSQEDGRTFAKIRPINLRKLPIPNNFSKFQKQLSEYYEELTINNSNNETLENINLYVCRIYELEFEQMKLILGNHLLITKNEYQNLI
jgi:adenine-specific DNA-methyltransferase